MIRISSSHKGENGKVVVVGGGPYFHGAPILCALGAEYGGVDLVYPIIPPQHAEVARTYSLNFILTTFEKEFLTTADVDHILEVTQIADVLVIGPGLGKEPKTQKAIKELFKEVKIPMVMDADALMYTNILPEGAVLTPHRGEFKRLTGEEPTKENVQKWAKSLKATIICKGPKDIIADGENLAINETGNAMMTVGGTGDVLAGLIGGLMAQKYTPFEAGKLATKTLGKIAEDQAETLSSLRAHDLAKLLPVFLPKTIE